ncbi:MAG TPA: amidohydrolase family protein [Blastocatellia bacterium]|nr:amidohydrolase family protein [Blastocatellia bacterium]
MSNSKPSKSEPKLSRRAMLKLTAAGAAGVTFLQRRAQSLPLAAESFLDRTTLETIADRETSGLKPPVLIDLQTHVWWRAGGIGKMTPRGENFLKTLAGARAAVIGRPVPVADMGRVMFFDDIFMQSQTDIAFLNSFGMRAAFDGVDLFPPREAAMIRSMAPSRIKVLGCVDPPDGKSAVESLSYQCETIKIDGLKLYPPGPDTRGWRMDDEKNTYPLYEVLRKHGVKNITVHKGLPGLFLEEFCHTDDLARAAADFPDLNFIAFHCSYPWEAELAEHGRKSRAKNIYAEMGGMARVMAQEPERFATMMGTLMDGLGADHLLWGTDTPVIGPPHWQIQGFQAFTIPDPIIEKNKYQQLTPEVKNKILGENVARLFNIDVKAAKKAVENDLLYKLREDGNPLPVVVDINKLRKQ